MKPITKGIWVPYPPMRSFPKEYYVGNNDGLCHVTINLKDREEAIADAELIADAGNTANECGMFPSELLKQRNELVECINLVLGSFALEMCEKFDLKTRCEKAIEKPLQ